MATSTATETDRAETRNPADRIAEIAKDVLYVGVGAGVLAFQRAQVQRVELTKAIEQRMADSRRQLADLTKAATTTATGQLAWLDERATAVEARVDDVLDTVQDRLPKPAAELLGQARTAAKATRTQVRGLIA
jgi:hypothetical protein